MKKIRAAEKSKTEFLHYVRLISLFNFVIVQKNTYSIECKIPTELAS
jgi:hypothetical protein